MAKGRPSRNSEPYTCQDPEEQMCDARNKHPMGVREAGSEAGIRRKQQKKVRSAPQQTPSGRQANGGLYTMLSGRPLPL